MVGWWLGGGVFPRGGWTDAEACGDGLIGVAVASHSLGLLLFALGGPEKNDDWEGDESDDESESGGDSHGWWYVMSD